MERITSQENLHDYMRVTSPKLWMLLIAIAALLAGFIAYAATAEMETTMDLTVTVKHFSDPNEDGTTHDYYFISGSLPESAYGTVQKDMPVRISDLEGTISAVIDSDKSDMLVLIQLDDEAAAWQLPDGEYSARIILDTTTPLSFLLS